MKAKSEDIFISYSRKDKEDVLRIKEALVDNGFSCWMDLHDVRSDDREFTECIANAIDATRVFLFFLSRNSQLSPWATNELRAARNEGKHIIFVGLGDVRMTTKFTLDFGEPDIFNWYEVGPKEKLLHDLADRLGLNVQTLLKNAHKLYSAHEYQRALCLYRQCSEHGSAEAKCFLGKMFYEEQGCQRDYGEAERLFREAAQLNYPRAWFFLGQMHEQFDNMAAAEECYQAASRLGDKYARKRLADLKWEDSFLHKVISSFMAFLKAASIILAIPGLLLVIAIFVLLLKLGLINF